MQIVELANLPLHFQAIWMQPDLSPEQRREQMIKMNWESIQHWHKTHADLEVQAGVVNALFKTKVDPVGLLAKELPPEYNFMPGDPGPFKVIQKMMEDPLNALDKNAEMLGKQSVLLSHYCQDSTQALSGEID